MTRGGTCSERSDKTGREANRTTRGFEVTTNVSGSEQVLGEGLEPSRLTAPEPKSGVSANFTTRADGPSDLSQCWQGSKGNPQVVAGRRIELRTQGFSVLCSTN